MNNKISFLLVLCASCLSYNIAIADVGRVVGDGTVVEDTAIVEDSGKCGDNMEWKIDSTGLLTISGTGKMYEFYYPDNTGKTPGVINIPWVEKNNAALITAVNVENGVENVSGKAFNTTSIESIVLPETVTELGINSFGGCLYLKNIILSDNIKVIPDEACSGNLNLKYIHMPSKLEEIGPFAFSGCHNLETPVLPSGVTEIGEGAFSDCIAFDTFILPEGITTVQVRTFVTCDNLESVFFPQGIKSIEREAFSGCFSLKEVILPDGLETIGDHAFSSGASRTENENVYIPQSVKTIGKDAFDEASTTIYGFEGSVAEEYANENNIEFVKVTESMYSVEDYNKAVNAQTDIIPEIPLVTSRPETQSNILTVASSDNMISIKAGEKAVVFEDAQPFVDENGRTQIPIRAVAETLGCTVDWNGQTRTAMLTKGNTVVVITIGEANMQVGTETVTMDTTAQIVNDRTYIPVRFVGEALGMEVNWIE